MSFSDFTDDVVRSVGFLSRIPMPGRFFVDHDGSLSRAVRAFPIAGLLISLSLGKNQDWHLARKSLLWTALFMCLSLVFMFVVLGITLPKAGGFGPDVWIGWPNRILMSAYGLWLMTVSLQAYKRQQA